MKIVALGAEMAAKNIGRLAEILQENVQRGAVVGFVLPFATSQAYDYWSSIFPSVSSGERVLLCAMANGVVAGTVQLYLSPEPNAPHRAEIFKLLVHPDYQQRGVGTALMQAAEVEAIRRDRSLVILDTVEGSIGERLYRRLGWQEIGVVPRHFVDPHGRLRSSVYFMKSLRSQER